MNQPDQEFFTGEASQLLALEFLREYPGSGFKPLLIQPISDHPGYHIFVSDGVNAFDVGGPATLDDLLTRFRHAQKEKDPSWAGDFQELEMVYFMEDYAYRASVEKELAARIRAHDVLHHYRALLSEWVR